MPGSSVDLATIHPPYFNIIEYSEQRVEGEDQEFRRVPSFTQASSGRGLQQKA